MLELLEINKKTSFSENQRYKQQIAPALTRRPDVAT